MFHSSRLLTSASLHSQNEPTAAVQGSPDDLFLAGFEYLAQVRQLAFSPDMIETAEATRDRIRICTWIGENIQAINLMLNAYLYACHQCFELAERPTVRILAAPLSERLGLDGLCNLWVEPTTILVDVGRVAPADWVCVVAHEYAHAYLKTPGHDPRFLAVLNHLCLGLDLPPLVYSPVGAIEIDLEQCLQSWPPCEALMDSLAFWSGDRPLFADAKAAEDLIQHRFGYFFASDFAQSLDSPPQVDSPEVEG